MQDPGREEKNWVGGKINKIFNNERQQQSLRYGREGGVINTKVGRIPFSCPGDTQVVTFNIQLT